ncbi:MAG TPA: glycosyltransferase family 1 protein [Thermoleophilaceae bacterium]|nr:glycosyltransferase family 1 protein [Thermoleophilaceae bacterium]
MHVAFSLLTLFPGRVGGSESNVRGLLREYVAGNGPERVTVLANAPVMDAYRERVGGPVALHRVHSYRQGDGSLTRLAAMTTAAVAPRVAARDVPRDVDVLHHPVTVPVPRLPGVPTLTTVYDLQHHELPGFFSRGERAFRRWAYDGAARAADLVLTSSEYSRERLVELAGVAPERAVAVHMGIDHERFVPAPTAADATIAQRLSLPERYVVYPANLWPHKNHERLVSAFAALDDPDLELLLTGQDYGRAGALVEQARRLGAGSRIRHLGYLEPEDVPALYRRATAMVFPSLYEGFGSPPLEAMACGCPVACSTRGSLAEVVGGAGLHFDPESVEEIAAATTRIVEDAALRSTLRARGLERAAEFTWEAAARRHVELYERALRL